MLFYDENSWKLTKKGIDRRVGLKITKVALKMPKAPSSAQISYLAMQEEMHLSVYLGSLN